LNSKNKKYFIWPTPKHFGGFKALLTFPSIQKIENELYKMFPSGYPVLCSSGRSALSLVLQNLKMTRSNSVGLFPYASHCVIDAISRNSTPLFGKDSNNADVRIVYHQWGFVQEKELRSNTIEDCVDTICKIGTDLFPGGGSFELWSLPKILGTSSGGILWCRDEKTAIEIRNLRNKRNGGLLQWILRLLSYRSKIIYYYWNGAECNGGMISRFQTGEILHALKKWALIFEDRKIKINNLWYLAPKFIQMPINRLPSVIPFLTDFDETKLVNLSLLSGYRKFNKVDKQNISTLVDVLPIPIHQDINQLELFDLINKLNKK
jgi:putative PLP-dependent aminotransferase (TIGR04422 family)